MSYPTAYRSSGARAKAGGLSVPAVGRGSEPASQSRAPTTSRGGYAPLRPWTPQSGQAGWRPPVAANANSLAAARVARTLGLALRIGRSVHPMLSLILVMLEAYRFLQDRWASPPLGLSYAGFAETHQCNFPNTGGPDKRGGPGSCLSGQGSPGPLSAGDPIQGAEWNNGFSVYGLITTLPFARWNMIASYEPIWQDTGIWNDDPKITLPPPSSIPAFVDPMVNAPFQTEAPPMEPPLWYVRARDRAMPEARTGEETERGSPEALPRGRIEFDFDPSLPHVVFVPGPPSRVPDDKRQPVRRTRRLPQRRELPAPGHPVELPEVVEDLRADGVPLSPGEVVIDRKGERVRPSQHRRRKPNDRTKERKAVVSAARTIAGRAFGAATETGDAVDAVYEALPEKLRARERMKRHGKDPRLTAKLRLIYDHAHEIDMVDAIDNLARNHLEDWFYGQLNRRAQQGLNRAGWQRPVGIQAGNTLGYTAEGLYGIRP